MKKIFRMALVFALAGATLMYTGCTKDYGEDIDNLDAKLSSVQDQLSKQLADLQTEVSNLRSSVSSLESAYKAADELIKGDVSDLKTRVGKLEDQVKDLNKYATKDELKEAREALEKKITDEIAALKADILKVTDDLAKEIADLKEELKKKADAEDVEAKLKALEDAQAEVDAVYGFLSDELRSIVFLPDFYFAGIEATSYDFGSFIGYLIYGNPYAATSFYYDEDEGDIMPWTNNTPSTETKYTFPNGAKWMTDLYYETDAKGNPVYYKYDPETYDWVYKDGKMVKGKEGEDNVRMYFPANHLQGQIGLANYNLNPSSFPVDSAEWSLNGRNVKYKLKAEEEETWYPVFEGISASNGLATVKYRIDNPEKIYSSILGAVIDCAINLCHRYYSQEVSIAKEVSVIDAVIASPSDLSAGTHYNWMEQAQNELLAREYGYNNIPTMQLVGTLSDGREIVSDWHAISSEEELVSHLAFAADNDYVTNWYDCGLNDDDTVKDLYMDAQWCVVNDPSVPVKWNGGPVDLQKLIAIHTSDYMSDSPIAEYSLDEFLAKYPGYHFEFELLPYNIGGNSTSEDKYGKLEGSMFTPCYVESAGGKATSIPIAKDSEDGISAVGRMPVVLVTLVNDETKDIHTFGWFKIVISKDAKPVQFFEIPDLGKVPYICSNYALKTKWHEFSYFVLEKLKVDYQQFIGSYKFEGAWVYANVLENGKVVKKLVPTTVTTEGVLQNVNFQDYNSNNKSYDTKKWGTAMYKKDESGSGINDAFTWNVNPVSIGEGKSQSLYFKFVYGDSVVYFEMKADVAKKAHMTFASNKINNLWFADIDAEPMNTVRISVPVPAVNPMPSVLDFKKDLNEFFVSNKPGLALESDSDPIYASIVNNYNSPYRSELLTTKTEFQFAGTQPLIATPELGHNTQLFVKTWKDYSVSGDKADYMKLYAVKYQFNMMKWAWEPVMETIEDKNGDEQEVYAIYDSELIATITKEGEGNDVKWIIKYENKDTAKYLLNLWSYKKTNQAEMLFANITAKNWYGSTSCASVADGGFHVRFIRPIDVDFADQDIAEESQVDGANVEVIKFFDGITDWNNQKVIVKNMVQKKDAEDKPIYDDKGEPVMVWDGTYAENIIKTINMYKYYGFEKLTIDIANAQRNNWNPQNPAEWGKISEKTPAHVVKIGTVSDEGVFTEDASKATADISDFNNLVGTVVNYRNTQGYAETFTIRIPVKIDYSWGTLSDYMIINIKDTGSTQPGN